MHICIKHIIAYKHIITQHINTYNLTYFPYQKLGYWRQERDWKTPKINNKNHEFLKKWRRKRDLNHQDGNLPKNLKFQET